jgi:hypothetical protein
MLVYFLFRFGCKRLRKDVTYYASKYRYLTAGEQRERSPVKGERRGTINQPIDAGPYSED